MERHIFTNTSDRLRSEGIKWDSKNPFTLGNMIYPTYDAGMSSNQPLLGVIGWDEYPFMACNLQGGVFMIVNISKEAMPKWVSMWEQDLKECIKRAENFSDWNELTHKTVWVKKELTLVKTVIVKVPRIFTWNSFKSFIVSEENSISLEDACHNTKFIRTADGKYFAKQNTDWYVETNNFEVKENEIMVAMPYHIERYDMAKCLFVITEQGVYEYEMDVRFDYQYAKQQINQKIKSDHENRITNKKVYENLEGLTLTVEDSYSVGNCEIGTYNFILRHKIELVDRKFHITSDNKERVWNIALREPQFMRVLKSKVAIPFEEGVEA